jgi:hypothetical protein
MTVICTLAPAFAQTFESRVLDNFDDISPWSASASDQVKAVLRQEQGVQGRALCLDYDFNGVSGYAFARRKLPLDFPGNYRFDLQLRGAAPANHLELKWIDASGDNVWWARRRDYTPTAAWQPWAIKARHIDFAWGPSQDTALRHSATMELVVTSGAGGGKGSVCFDELRFTPLPVVAVTPPPPVPTPLPAQPPFAGEWRVDLGQVREFGGVVLHWGQGAPARYEVQFSDDALQWRTVRSVQQGAGPDHWLLLPESEARWLRVLLRDGTAQAFPLARMELRELAFGATPNAFFEALAKSSAPGLYPRGFSGQQPYWTLLGVDGGSASGLIGEDGAIEVGKGGFSIEPFLVTGPGAAGRVGWAQVQAKQDLQDGYLPIPAVHWKHQDLTLDVTAMATGSPQRAQLLGRYTLGNHGSQTRKFKLVLALRPFQVNPPRQFLNTPGGVSAIRAIAWDRQAVSVNGLPRVWPLQAPDAFVATPFEAGHVLDRLEQPMSAAAQSVVDEFGYASAALVYEVTLAPHGRKTFDLLMPLAGAVQLPPAASDKSRWAQQQQDALARNWREKLNRVNLQLPQMGQAISDTLRSSLAHMLMSRDGAALQPGTRSYARSWIRDGAMMVEGLERLGQDRVASEFVEWFAPYQFDSGKVPCCVDKRGADPVPENDSHGQLIFAIAELYRYTQDRQQLQRLWPHVARAANYLETLRQSERTPQNRVGECAAFWGMMPASISHEGYSAKPMHSYWDNFWALRGYKDAAMLATVLGRSADAARIAQQRDEFRRELQQSLALTAQRFGVDYLAGAAELGDFDATSSTVALSPGGEQENLDPALVRGTFERYWKNFVARRDGPATWDDYTPYELRTVGSLVRLGQVGRAHEALKFFFADQRPRGWNQWAEVVGREARTPRFIGDMPHTWISSDFVRSALDLFAYERESDQALVLAAGVPVDWLKGRGVAVAGLRTSQGSLGYRLRLAHGRLLLDLSPGTMLPAGGAVLSWPASLAPPPALVNGRALTWDGATLRISRGH